MGHAKRDDKKHVGVGDPCPKCGLHVMPTHPALR
jgi:hypothetical protein